DRRGLAEQADLGRERRLVARLAAVALERVEERGLLAADVGPGAAPQLEVEAHAVAQDVGPEEAALVAAPDRVLEQLGGERIFAPDVEEAALAAGGEARDGHRLDERERIALHQHAVLEGAR